MTEVGNVQYGLLQSLNTHACNCLKMRYMQTRAGIRIV